MDRPGKWHFRRRMPAPFFTFEACSAPITLMSDVGTSATRVAIMNWFATRLTGDISG
jgi:hypothetical protein